MSEPLLRIQNHHAASCGDPPIVATMLLTATPANSKIDSVNSGFLRLTVEREQPLFEVAR